MTKVHVLFLKLDLMMYHMIEDGQTLFSMQFEPNTEIPEFIYGVDINSNYQGQGLKLGKHFIQQ